MLVPSVETNLVGIMPRCVRRTRTVDSRVGHTPSEHRCAYVRTLSTPGGAVCKTFKFRSLCRSLLHSTCRTSQALALRMHAASAISVLPCWPVSCTGTAWGDSSHLAAHFFPSVVVTPGQCEPRVDFRRLARRWCLATVEKQQLLKDHPCTLGGCCSTKIQFASANAGPFLVQSARSDRPGCSCGECNTFFRGTRSWRTSVMSMQRAFSTVICCQSSETVAATRPTCVILASNARTLRAIAESPWLGRGAVEKRIPLSIHGVLLLYKNKIRGFNRYFFIHAVIHTLKNHTRGPSPLREQLRHIADSTACASGVIPQPSHRRARVCAIVSAIKRLRVWLIVVMIATMYFLPLCNYLHHVQSPLRPLGQVCSNTLRLPVQTVRSVRKKCTLAYWKNFIGCHCTAAHLLRHDAVLKRP